MRVARDPIHLIALLSGRRRQASWRSFVLAGLVASITLSGAGMHGAAFAQSAMAPDVSTAECDQLASLPNPPISVETCKAMLGMAAAMGAASGDPRGQRPGDNAMTCPQIFAELQTMAGVGISELNLEKSDAVVTEGVALADKQATTLSTFMIASFAMGTAMGAASAFLPNFVTHAIGVAWAAQFAALGVKAQAEQAPINARISEVIQSNAGELMDSMQANPRFARLGQLAMAKECEAPEGAR